MSAQTSRSAPMTFFRSGSIVEEPEHLGIGPEFRNAYLAVQDRHADAPEPFAAGASDYATRIDCSSAVPAESLVTAPITRRPLGRSN